MSKEDTGEGKGIMPSAFLLAAVVVVMVAGMFLRTDATRVLPPAAGPASPAPSLPLGSTITPELTPASPVEAAEVTEPKVASAIDPLVVKLAARVEVDCGRLAKARGRWTAQLLVACKPETVDRMLGMAHESSALYVLPVQVKDDPCFRVCFGAYATSKEAALAADLPKALRGKERIGPVEIAKVLP
jgi:hypothetical protein